MCDSSKENEVHKMNSFTVVMYFALAAIFAFLFWLFCYFEYGKYMVDKHQKEWNEIAKTIPDNMLDDEYCKFIDMLIKTRNGYLPKMTREQKERCYQSRYKEQSY